MNLICNVLPRSNTQTYLLVNIISDVTGLNLSQVIQTWMIRWILLTMRCKSMTGTHVGVLVPQMRILQITNTGSTGIRQDSHMWVLQTRDIDQRSDPRTTRPCICTLIDQPGDQNLCHCCFMEMLACIWRIGLSPLLVCQAWGHVAHKVSLDPKDSSRSSPIGCIGSPPVHGVLLFMVVSSHLTLLHRSASVGGVP
jgi:hypothetical protein